MKTVIKRKGIESHINAYQNVYFCVIVGTDVAIVVVICFFFTLRIVFLFVSFVQIISITICGVSFVEQIFTWFQHVLLLSFHLFLCVSIVCISVSSLLCLLPLFAHFDFNNSQIHMKYIFFLVDDFISLLHSFILLYFLYGRY